MAQEKGILKKETLDWLLEPNNPNVRYFTLREILCRPEEDREVKQAREEIMESDPVAAILMAQQPEGYWARTGGGFSPSYTSTLYQIYFLGELGALPGDEQVKRGCEYFLEQALASSGGVSMSRRPVPSSVVHCMSGDLLCALIHLGYGEDPRVQAILNWQIKAILGTREVKFYKSTTCAPGFACGNNSGVPCAWGGLKALKALSAVPAERRSLEMKQAIEKGVELLLSVNPAEGDYPGDIKNSRTWLRFGFPLIYRTDVLECASILSALGYGEDSRLDDTFALIKKKQDVQGRWKLEKSLNGKMWSDIEKQGRPSKWITYRALQAMKKAGRLG